MTPEHELVRIWLSQSCVPLSAGEIVKLKALKS